MIVPRHLNKRHLANATLKQAGSDLRF